MTLDYLILTAYTKDILQLCYSFYFWFGELYG